MVSCLQHACICVHGCAFVCAVKIIELCSRSCPPCVLFSKVCPPCTLFHISLNHDNIFLVLVRRLSYRPSSLLESFSSFPPHPKRTHDLDLPLSLPLMLSALLDRRLLRFRDALDRTLHAS